MSKLVCNRIPCKWHRLTLTDLASVHQMFNQCRSNKHPAKEGETRTMATKLPGFGAVGCKPDRVFTSFATNQQVPTIARFTNHAISTSIFTARCIQYTPNDYHIFRHTQRIITVPWISNPSLLIFTKWKKTKDQHHTFQVGFWSRAAVND